LTPVVLFLVGFVFSLIPIAAFFGKIVRRNGKVVVYLPLFVYDLSVYGFWWLNIAPAGSIRRKGSAGSVSGGSVTAALRARRKRPSSSLTPSPVEDMIANWRGRVVQILWTMLLAAGTGAFSALLPCTQSNLGLECTGASVTAALVLNF